VSPVAFWTAFAIFVLCGVGAGVCLCVIAKRGDDRMQRWMHERQQANAAREEARVSPDAERMGEEAEEFLAGVR
jgi:hypothetical protein